MFQDRRTATILTVALCLVYIAARLWRLTDSCLWFDELFSIHAAEHAWNSLFWFVAQDLIHPPLFYAVLKVWIGIGGEGLLWLRLLPVFFSIIALVPFLYLCKELKLSNAVTLLALILLAVNGSLIKYTQTLRMYTLLMFLSIASLWLFARYFNRGKSFVPLLIVNLLLIYAHYFAWLVVGAEIVALLAFQRIKWRRMLTMVAVLVAAFTPWMIAVLKAADAGSDVGQNISWMSRPGWIELRTFVFDLTEPFYFQASNAEPSSIYRVSAPLLLILTTAIIIYFVNLKSSDDKQVPGLLAIFAIVPAIVAFLASWVLPYSVWGTRHLIVIYAPASILLAYFVTRIPTAWVRIGAVTLIILLSGYAFALQASRKTPRYVWCAWDEVAADIRSRSEPVNIYSFENLVAYHLWFALRDSANAQVHVVKGVDVRTDDETYFLPRGFDGVPNVRLEDIKDEKFWLAFRTSVDGDDGPLIENFTKLGYKLCSSDRVKYDSTTVFWVEVRKAPQKCE
jgi:uncharacterized membrane protein